MNKPAITAKTVFLNLPAIGRNLCLSLLAFAVATFVIASCLKPSLHYATTESHFKQTIPSAFADWHEVEQTTPQVNLVSDERSLVNQLYDDVLMRTYINSNGQLMMVALAYAKEQRQDVKIHQPDICYPAQGYQMLLTKNKLFDSIPSQSPIDGRQQLYTGQGHLEAVSYWIRVGDETLTSGLQMRLKIIKDGLLHRRLDDGVLVRVSSVIANENEMEKAFNLQEAFLKELVTAVHQRSEKLLVP